MHDMAAGGGVSGRHQTYPDKRVAVLLAVYNGEKYLRDQIDTLARQQVANIDIWASDDGSSDASHAIMQGVADGWAKGKVTLLDGPRRGFAENFRSLMTNGAIDADFYAFCDQDDLWDTDKLSVALDWLTRQDPSRPALYCTRTRAIDADGKPTGLSPLFRSPPGFRNAMVQSIAGANTMVMNRAAWTIVGEASRRTGFVSHDWWCYLIVSGSGGLVHYSAEPRTSYRQHPGNLVGENSSWRARMFRARSLVQGLFTSWNAVNVAALRSCEDLLVPEARKVVEEFARARETGSVAGIAALMRSGVYRQTVMGQFGLFLACLLRKL